MSGAALSADMPGEEQEKFKQFMIQIDMSMSDEEIVNKLTYYLENENFPFKREVLRFCFKI